MAQRGFAASGLVVALVGFGLTRFTVTLAVTDTAVGFLFAGVVPLVVGLGLAAGGVLLAVGRYDRMLVRTTAVWCLVGTVAMAVLVVLTLLGSEMHLTDMETIREQTYLSTFLIGGAAGGTLTGLYAGQNRCYRRDVQQQANRLEVLNRLLRDQVINAATAIRGHQEILEHDHDEQSVAVIGTKADEIVGIVEEVKYLAESTDTPTGQVDLIASVERELSAVQAAYPDAEFTFDGPEAVEIRGTERVGEAIRHLLVNAVVHSDRERPHVEVTVETSRPHATLRVSDDGPGLPEAQQALLERGEIAAYDDPTTGFGLNVVRLLVERFDGLLRTEVSDAGTSIELTLPRVADQGSGQSAHTAGTGIPPSRVAVAVGVSLIAGLVMAGSMATLDGDLLAIGKLYGIENPLVTAFTHEFHSVVFGMMYASVLAVVPVAYARGLVRRLAIGVVFGLSLWLFAAGLVMPVWLKLTGVEAPLPNLTLPSLVAHVTWGATVSSCYHLGDRWLHRRDR